MPEYTIRTASDGDHTDIIRVNRAAWDVAYTHIYTPDEIDGLFGGNRTQTASWTDRRTRRMPSLVAEVDDRVVGFVGTALLKKTGHGEITHLYLHPDYHKRGIGGALWRAGLDELRRMKRYTVWVWVLERATAYQFYLHQGCRVRETGTYRVGDHIETAKGCVINLCLM